MTNIILNESKKIYFVSDHHFGGFEKDMDHRRERIFIDWLNTIEEDCGVLFILGDFIDFWVEYKKVVPKGFVRVFGKLAQLSDNGIKIYYFLGNHDLWARNYFEQELGIEIFHEPSEFNINEKTFLLGHGDGLGNVSPVYTFIKKLYTNRTLQFLLRWTHPDIGIAIGQYLSKKQKNKHQKIVSKKENKDVLLEYVRTQQILDKGYDYIIFGHQHHPKEEKLNDKTTYFNSGDWIDYNSYIEFEQGICVLKTYNKEL